MNNKLVNPDYEYDRAIDRSMTIEAILALDRRLSREYLNTLNTDALHDLEDSLVKSKQTNVLKKQDFGILRLMKKLVIRN